MLGIEHPDTVSTCLKLEECDDLLEYRSPDSTQEKLHVTSRVHNISNSTHRTFHSGGSTREGYSHAVRFKSLMDTPAPNEGLSHSSSQEPIGE